MLLSYQLLGLWLLTSAVESIKKKNPQMTRLLRIGIPSKTAGSVLKNQAFPVKIRAGTSSVPFQ
jgi:hypothetical protein